MPPGSSGPYEVYGCAATDGGGGDFLLTLTADPRLRPRSLRAGWGSLVAEMTVSAFVGRRPWSHTLSWSGVANVDRPMDSAACALYSSSATRQSSVAGAPASVAESNDVRAPRATYRVRAQRPASQAAGRGYRSVPPSLEYFLRAQAESAELAEPARESWRLYETRAGSGRVGGDGQAGGAAELAGVRTDLRVAPSDGDMSDRDSGHIAPRSPPPAIQGPGRDGAIPEPQSIQGGGGGCR